MENKNFTKEFDYRIDDILNFMEEEFERIIQFDSHIDSNNMLSDSRALAAWYLRQEIGTDYENIFKFILDDKNDCGVDLIWIDEENNEILIGQVEYEGKKWGISKINKEKAINTFNQFRNYLENYKLPENLPEISKDLWRKASKLINSKGFTQRYIYISPKAITSHLENDIQNRSGIRDFEICDYQILLERAHEFIDGQTGLSNFYFKLADKEKYLKIKLDNGIIYMFDIPIAEIYRIVKSHKIQKRLKSLFASNVRSYLNKSQLSKEIGLEIRKTIEKEPSNFMMYNNGLTIQAKSVKPKGDKLQIQRASISNGCQTSMNIFKYFEENRNKNPKASVLVTIIQLNEYSSSIAGEIARYRNFQNEVNYRDLRSNDPLLVTLQHRMFAENLSGSNKRYFIQRKRGEKEGLLQEEPTAKGKYLWIDVEHLAKCIASVLRQKPELSTEGSNQLFGEFYKEIFPGINEPSYKKCKYAFWIVYMINHSYSAKSKWKNIVKDQNIFFQKDFKKPAKWYAAALLHKTLSNFYDVDRNNNFTDIFSKNCEILKYGKKKPESLEFQRLTNDMIENCFVYMHAIAKDSLNKEIRKNIAYTSYNDLFKGPNFEIFKKGLSSNSYFGKKKNLMKSIEKLLNLLDYSFS